jgi:hypothetical protein
MISEDVQKMILSALESMEVTSASPGHINRLIQVENIDVGNIDQSLEQEIRRIVSEVKDKELKQGKSGNKSLVSAEEERLKLKKDIKNQGNQIKTWKQGNVADLHAMSSAQFGNVKAIAANPTSFIVNTFIRKFAKGAGAVALALLIFDAVKWVVAELAKPGRLLDRKFKRDIHNEILAFRKREDKQKLAQGYSRIIVTSMPRLRGGQSQTFDSFRQLASGKPVFPGDSFMIAQPKGSPISTESKTRGEIWNNATGRR